MKTASASTLQDDIYDKLRHMLMLGHWLPGERLKINHLASELGVSQMPVRAALQRLAAEKALVSIPNCGVTVPQLTVAQFDDILQNRILLEGEAAYLGAQQLDAAAREQLVTRCRQMDAAIAGDDVKAYLDANELFHLTLYHAANSPLLLSLIETVWLHVGPISNQLHQDLDVWKTMNDAHGVLLQALQDNDAGGVRAAIAQDLRTAGSYLRRLCLP
ncbi:GntR family transcriptional regulator [Crenobacter sp. SG2305]|uniref:GntR family transcriptional regulator n=1 Tax=Crenobacter oryzisoli TaxID=3056844 RepID=UPI0025AB447B|nr:GntR family transcriptional regulator [Crenobacter sp. SG2305]MDN0084636.1 GntR family transcriptional regulator [Crenobacter sp. SG2305]